MTNGIEKHLTRVLHRGWWLLLLRGVAAIIFGVLTWLQPGISLVVLVLYFGAYSLVDGIFGAVAAIAGRKMTEYWWVLLLESLVGIGIGVMTFVVPGITALALLFYIAIWAIATGVLEIVAAIRLRREIEGEILLVLAGLISVVFGVLLIAQPAAGVLTLVWLIASFAVAFGILLLLLAFKARGFARQFSGS